jgi:hypothetical protein
VKKFGLDDLFIAVAVVRCQMLDRDRNRCADLVKSLGGLQTVTVFMQVQYGRGRHAKMLHVDSFDEMLKVCGSSISFRRAALMTAVLVA